MTLNTQALIRYVKSYEKPRLDFEFCVTEHLRVSGIYWGAHTLHLVGAPAVLTKEATVDFVLQCQKRNGGFAGNIGEDANLLHTLSALQVLLLHSTLNPRTIDYDATANYIGCSSAGTRLARGLLQPDGSFLNDEWSDKDTRSTYCALAVLALLNKLHVIDADLVAGYIVSCCNWDAGFGSVADTESHSGQIFCCLASLSILAKLDLVASRRMELVRWLSERQLESGGLNGRPGKVHDTCYSWWVLASLSILGANLPDWMDVPQCIEYVLSTEDRANGGFAPRPKERSDVFHTHFAVAGLSLLGLPGVQRVDAVFCLPKELLQAHFGK